jgi:hypothetical protein
MFQNSTAPRGDFDYRGASALGDFPLERATHAARPFGALVIGKNSHFITSHSLTRMEVTRIQKEGENQ